MEEEGAVGELEEEEEGAVDEWGEGGHTANALGRYRGRRKRNKRTACAAWPRPRLKSLCGGGVPSSHLLGQDVGVGARRRSAFAFFLSLPRPDILNSCEPLAGWLAVRVAGASL